MTDVKIIEWAKKCGWDNPATNMAPLYEFAKLVAQHEREYFCALLRQLHDSISLQSDPDGLKARGEA